MLPSYLRPYVAAWCRWCRLTTLKLQYRRGFNIYIYINTTTMLLLTHESVLFTVRLETCLNQKKNAAGWWGGRDGEQSERQEKDKTVRQEGGDQDVRETQVNEWEWGMKNRVRKMRQKKEQMQTNKLLHPFQLNQLGCCLSVYIHYRTIKHTFSFSIYLQRKPVGLYDHGEHMVMGGCSYHSSTQSKHNTKANCWMEVLCLQLMLHTILCRQANVKSNVCKTKPERKAPS